MAYTNLDFYKTEYWGSMIPDKEFPRFAEKASCFLDVITFDRLADGLPENERAKTKVQKAVCAVADKLYQLELAERQGLSAAAGDSVSSGSGGITTGVITSRSAGSESVSYASLSEMANGAKTWSAIYQAAGDEQATNKLLSDTAKVYLMGVKDNEGTLLLYAGL